MIIKERYRIFDEILNTLEKEDSLIILTSKLAEKINIDFYIISSLCDDLINEGFLINRNSVAVRDNKLAGDKFVQLSQKGRFLIKEEGGFKTKYTKYKYDKCWSIIKIIAVGINALAIIFISIWAVRVADRINNPKEPTNKDSVEMTIPTKDYNE